MDDVVQYCPHCQENRSVYEQLQAGSPVVRCAMCGFLLEGGLASQQRREASGAVSGKPKVLCIDDDPLVLRILVSALEANDFTPVTAPDGPTGLEMARRERPVLILLDIMMPGMDGFEVSRRLRADAATQAIPIIILTALSDAKLNIRAFQAGADLALTKPFAPDKLIATVRAALALKQKLASS